jgi:hypothetical protein
MPPAGVPEGEPPSGTALLAPAKPNAPPFIDDESAGFASKQLKLSNETKATPGNERLGERNEKR